MTVDQRRGVEWFGGEQGRGVCLPSQDTKGNCSLRNQGSLCFPVQVISTKLDLLPERCFRAAPNNLVL